MIIIECTDEELDARVKAVCAPLYASSRLLFGGHSMENTNATVTFIRFESKIYAVTCHHVLAAFAKEASERGVEIAPTIHAGKTIFQFHHYGAKNEKRWSFVSCRDFPTTEMLNDAAALSDLERRNLDRPDIAIADITDIWPAICESRPAEAINLDDWVEPDWSKFAPVWIAYGFPTGHKYHIENKVAAPMPRVRVELASSVPTIDKPTYTLWSHLEEEHGWGFSGLSGGPVLVSIHDKKCFAYIGITFEGAPSLKDATNSKDSIVNGRDIVLTGYNLTPHTFRNWLAQAKFGVEISWPIAH